MEFDERSKLYEGTKLLSHFINAFENRKDFTSIREDKNLINLTFFTGNEIDRFFLGYFKTIDEKKVFINTVTLLGDPGLTGNFNEYGMLHRGKIRMSISEAKNNLIEILRILDSNIIKSTLKKEDKNDNINTKNESEFQSTVHQNIGAVINGNVIGGYLVTGDGNLSVANHNGVSNNDERIAKKGNRIAIVGIMIASILAISAIITPFLVDYFSTVHNDKSLSNQEKILNYFITISVSDTISTNFESAKKIIVTASADTDSMIITSESPTDTYGPFNMTMETARQYNFIAVFYETGTHTVTITSYSQNGEVASEIITIEV